MLTQEETKPRVLIVDDEPLVIELLRCALESIAQVIVAADGTNAIMMAHSAPLPDLILLDVGLPDIDGHEVCRQLKKSPTTADIPVIFTTARDMSHDESQGFAAGAVDYITKPLNLTITVARVRVHLESRRLHREIKQHNEHLDQLVQERTRELEAEMRHRQEMEKRFIHQACHDATTGLPNLSLLRRSITQHTTESPTPFAVALIAITGFHEINNTLGHQHGNQLLAQVAMRLQKVSQGIENAIAIEQDNVTHKLARVEGVCFGLLFSGSNHADITEHVEQLLKVLDKPVEYQGMTLNFGGVAGITVSPDHGRDFNTLLRHTHIACEQAQHLSTRLAFYADEMNPYNERRLSLMGELRSAISQNTLKLAFQPQVCLSDNSIVSTEALIRWQHPQLGFVPPDEFIPLAEQTGVIKSLTQWVLNEAIQQCMAFEEAGHPLIVSINLSARNLREADLVDTIGSLLSKYQLPAHRLILEITETAVMENPQEALKVLEALNESGVCISIDDFGTGYSSLGYLRNLPAKELKVDRSFIMNMTKNRADMVLVQTVIDMARNLDLRVVAEGVEDSDTLAMLNHMGCDAAQGYHLCRPIPPEELRAWLDAEKKT